MSFFKSSFNSVGETLRTVSLAIGLLVTSVTGVGYIYNLISEQKAMAVSLDNQDGRIRVLEAEQKQVAIDRFRLQNTEKGVQEIIVKLDRFVDAFNDYRAENPMRRGR